MTEALDLHRQAALRHEQAAANHDRAAKFWDRQGRCEQAGLQRELAGYERQGAELETKWAELMDAQAANDAVAGEETARGSTRKNAEHLSSELDRTADAFEQTAVIAQQRAQTGEVAGPGDRARDERLVAERAREYAQRARSQAEEWRRLAARIGR